MHQYDFMPPKQYIELDQNKTSKEPREGKPARVELSFTTEISQKLPKDPGYDLQQPVTRLNMTH